MSYVKNFEKDPTCVRKRDNWNVSVTLMDDGTYKYSASSNGTVFIWDKAFTATFAGYMVLAHVKYDTQPETIRYESLLNVQTRLLDDGSCIIVAKHGPTSATLDASTPFVLLHSAIYTVEDYETILSLSLSGLPYWPYFDSSSLPLPV